MKIIVYGDVNLNLIDGSAIWAQSMVQVASQIADSVQLLLKAPDETDRLTAPLRELGNVEIIRPFEEQLLPGLVNSLSPNQAVKLIVAADQRQPADAIIVRGRRIAEALANHGSLAGRLWTYLTDIPHSSVEFEPDDVAALTTIVRGSSALLCQTEDLRSLLEVNIPEAVGKSFLYPPVVSTPPVRRTARRGPSQPVELVYSGKMALAWLTDRMTELPALLADHGIDATIAMIGDKIHREPADPDFEQRMRDALTSTDGVIWHGGMPREAAMRTSAAADIGLSWRSPEIDRNLELSTKVLEFGSMGLPTVLNRTPAHEQLLGHDYPLFANSIEHVVEAIVLCVRDHATYRDAAARCESAAAAHAMPRAVERLRAIARSTGSAADVGPNTRDRPRRVLVASHDLKFMSRLIDVWQTRNDIELSIDEWETLVVHDEAQSEQHLRGAETIVCEWFGPNAIWYSHRKRPDQRLIVRLHRFELYSNYPGRADLSAIDRIVCVNDYYRELTLEKYPSLSADQVICVPNWVDIDAFDRTKSMDPRFHLGMIGIAPRRKRLDIGLDILAELRRQDPRFHLFVKTKMPWDYWWIWNDPDEQVHYTDQLRRIQTDPLLVGAVSFDPFGPDVAAWLRKIGIVLSTSDDESFHLAPAEGMASGAIPVVFPWLGADTVYDDSWLVTDVESAVEAIVTRTADQSAFEEWSVRAKADVRSRFDLHQVASTWVDLLMGH